MQCRSGFLIYFFWKIKSSGIIPFRHIIYVVLPTAIGTNARKSIIMSPAILIEEAVMSDEIRLRTDISGALRSL